MASTTKTNGAADPSSSLGYAQQAADDNVQGKQKQKQNLFSFVPKGSLSMAKVVNKFKWKKQQGVPGKTIPENVVAKEKVAPTAANDHGGVKRGVTQEQNQNRDLQHQRKRLARDTDSNRPTGLSRRTRYRILKKQIEEPHRKLYSPVVPFRLEFTHQKGSPSVEETVCI